MLDLFENQTLDAMTAYMGRLSRRQQVVSSNLANIDTPGYKTKDVSFHATMEELLADRSGDLRTTRARHIDAASQGASPADMAFEVKGLIERVDENNVDIDREMMKLSETSFGYTMMTQLLRAKLNTLSASIREGSA
jgi:flagellar basal-body rod protein FlgB